MHVLGLCKTALGLAGSFLIDEVPTGNLKEGVSLKDSLRKGPAYYVPTICDSPKGTTGSEGGVALGFRRRVGRQNHSDCSS